MAAHFFAPQIETLFNEGKADLSESEARIYNLWVFVGKGFKPWEVEPDYEDNERIIKLEDKADLLKLDQFNYNAEINRRKKKDTIAEFGLEAGQHIEKQNLNPLKMKKDLVFD